jgi:tRNA pseudouridine55 synthase
LGKVSKVDFDIEKKYFSIQNFEKEIKTNLKYFKGNLKQKYPIYSSKSVKGKPLFSYARSGEDVEIPEKEIFIKKILLTKVSKINSDKLFINIEKRIKKVKGDFRQKEILKIWKNKLLNKKSSSLFYVADFKLECSSGTYVRQIANSLGGTIGIPALALYIKRTKVGRFK